MITTNTITLTRDALATLRLAGKTIGLVPTMGALHQGHVSLIRACRAECDVVAVSLFVNPSQFAPGEDLECYPHTFETDSQSCLDEGVDLLFAPMTGEMYPQENLTWIIPKKLGDHLCGQSRPNFFRGICTIVAKLFNIITPDRAYFGQKDAQQLAIIKRMVSDLNFNIEIRTCPTIREPDGLALSSRNRYLKPQERSQARCLYESLQLAQDLIAKGQLNSAKIITAMTDCVKKQPQAQIDYISILDSELLQPINQVTGSVLIALAVQIGPARLIDNILVDLNL
jgi:pantoate--beta-alanine ligase